MLDGCTYIAQVAKTLVDTKNIITPIDLSNFRETYSMIPLEIYFEKISFIYDLIDRFYYILSNLQNNSN